MPAVWSYVPQAVMTETLTTAVRIAQVSPQAEVRGWMTSSATRAWRLQYTTVDTRLDQAMVTSMVAAFDAAKGSWTALTWRNPNDQQDYTVRFDSTLTTELFMAGLHRTGDVLFIAVTS